MSELSHESIPEEIKVWAKGMFFPQIMASD
jgi:hypothetical protein